MKYYEIEFGVSVVDDLDEVVRAAQWIDDNLKLLSIPEDWRDIINPAILDLTDPLHCVIGQVTDYCLAHTHVHAAENRGAIALYVFVDREIQDAWVEYFHAHRLATNA